MKNIRFLTLALLLGALVLSACGAGAAVPTSTPIVTASAGGGAMPVSFIGIVDSITGDQWVISGTTVTVDPSIVRDGPFNVGDQIKVEGFVHSDGSFTVSRVELPTPQETATLPPFGNDNSNDGGTNVNTNDANTNDSNTNDDDNGGNTNDDNSNDSNSNDGNTNDDNGGNSNDDNSNSGNDNGDDDNDNDGNNNDDNSNNDHGGGNSNDDNDNDDNGGNSNDD